MTESGTTDMAVATVRVEPQMIPVEFRQKHSILDLKPKDRLWPLAMLPRIDDVLRDTDSGFQFRVKEIAWEFHGDEETPTKVIVFVV